MLKIIYESLKKNFLEKIDLNKKKIIAKNNKIK